MENPIYNEILKNRTNERIKRKTHITYTRC